MSKDYAMLDVSCVGGKENEGDDEVELNLELSIGGSYKKSMKTQLLEPKSRDLSCDVSETDKGLLRSRSSVSQSFFGGVEPGSTSEFVDPRRKRQIQAVRRREARRKREEKLKRGGMNGGGGGSMNAGLYAGGDKVMLEAEPFQTRVRNREIGESEYFVEEPAQKKIESFVDEEIATKQDIEDLNITLNLDGASNNQKHASNPTAYTPSPSLPVKPVHYACPSLQHMPYNNGFVYPCVMPWQATSTAAATNVEKNKNLFQPLACQSFRPYQNSDHNMQLYCDPERHSSKAVSNVSVGCSSSAVSDNQSTSEQGNSSSDTRSHSSHSQQEEQLKASATNGLPQNCERSGSSNQMVSDQAIEKVVSSTVPNSSPLKPSEQPTTNTHSGPVPISTTQNQTAAQLKETKEISGKPPKPKIQNQDITSVSQMPCVSATGNGPNGKTITGFLYRYLNSEVSIVCVCHGSSFSPAEFVEHAGGVDVTHPLRHITMVPSAFGL